MPLLPIGLFLKLCDQHFFWKLIAIAWSPHHHGLLASGGGTADRCIRFWNTLTGQPMQCIDTGSQVCNLAWSKHSSELVSPSLLTIIFPIKYFSTPPCSLLYIVIFLNR